MRKYRLFALAILLFAGLAFTGCSDDDDDIVDLGPSLTLKTGEGYTSADFEVEEGTTLKFGVTAEKSTTHDNYLAKFQILYNELTIVDTALNTATFNADYMIKFLGVGTFKMTFIVTAQGGMTDEVELNVTVKEPVVPGVEVKKSLNVEFGSYNDPIGSFYNSVDDTVYTVPEAFQEQAKVDFLFFKGVDNMNTIAAPDDEDANTITDFQLNTWTTKNPTRFVMTAMTAEEFDAIGEMHEFPEFDEENAASKANLLEVGNVVMFRTVGQKLGYFKVVDIYTKGDKMKIDVIVEK